MREGREKVGKVGASVWAHTEGGEQVHMWWGTYTGRE